MWLCLQCCAACVGGRRGRGVEVHPPRPLRGSIHAWRVQVHAQPPSAAERTVPVAVACANAHNAHIGPHPPCLVVQVVFPLGVPPEAANVAPANVFGVQVPVSANPEGMETVLVDIYKKQVADAISYSDK